MSTNNNNIPMTHQQIIARMTQDLQNGVIKIVSGSGYRFYTDVLTETLNVPITTPTATAEDYYKQVIAKENLSNTVLPGQDPFDLLPRVSMYIGQPDTGKTYKAEQIAKQCGITPLFKMCRDNLNLETLLEDFTLVDGKPVFNESLAIKLMSGTEKAIIIFDEFNTLLTGVMKTLQPIFDDTSTTFEYRGKVYNKNMNCKFIVTLNDKDKGISIVPDAILSRSFLKWFNPVGIPTIAQWTNTDVKYVTTIHDIYKALGMLNIFGTRQIKAIKAAATQQDIKDHLYGLCMMRNVDPSILESLPMKQLLSKL